MKLSQKGSWKRGICRKRKNFLRISKWRFYSQQ